MDKQIKRHLDKRQIRLAHGRQAQGLFGIDSGMDAFLRWFHDDVMMFDSMEYRRQFWREACRYGHTIGHKPQTVIEFTDPWRHPYCTWLANIAIVMAVMGVSAVVWHLVHVVDIHIRCLRRPTYYEVERVRRLRLAEARRRIRKRRTTNPCPTPDILRLAFAHVHDSTENMIRFGSLLEDLECYVDNSVVWSATEGRIVGRRGGIRQWLRERAPDLAERYKTIMKYKALAKKFRQAVGVEDPIPAVTLLPSDSREKDEAKSGDGSREHCTERFVVIRRNGDSVNGAHGHEREMASKETARSLLAMCEGTVASLTAQLALMVSEGFVPSENIARKNDERQTECLLRAHGSRKKLATGKLFAEKRGSMPG